MNQNGNPRPKLEYQYRPPHSYKVPKQTWLQRNPRLTVHLITVTGLLVFFSRPIYDIFFRDYSGQEVIDRRNK